MSVDRVASVESFLLSTADFVDNCFVDFSDPPLLHITVECFPPHIMQRTTALQADAIWRPFKHRKQHPCAFNLAFFSSSDMFRAEKQSLLSCPFPQKTQLFSSLV